MIYNCPLPVLDEVHEHTEAWQAGDEEEAPRRLYLRRCGAPLVVYEPTPGGWLVDENGTNAGDLENGSGELRCLEGHVLMTVYNDTNTAVAPITEDWVRQAVEFVNGVDFDLSTAPQHPTLAKCPHCGAIGNQGGLRWHAVGCWWLQHLKVVDRRLEEAP